MSSLSFSEMEDMVLDFHLKFGHPLGRSLAVEQASKDTRKAVNFALLEASRIICDLAAKLRPLAEEAYDNGKGDVRLYRLWLRIEELGEEAADLESGSESELAGEMVDSLYLLIGTSLTLSLPLIEVFRAKHNSNMSKGSKLKGGKSYKGPGYFPPNLSLGLQKGREVSKWIPRKVVVGEKKQICDVCGFMFQGTDVSRCPICKGPTTSSKRRSGNEGV